MNPSVQSPRFPARSAVFVAVALSLITACSGGGSKTASAGATCRQPKDSATWRAVISYANSSNPPARRFLSASAGDSALPEVGLAALQERGPTWLFPADSAGRSKVRNRLDDGIANTMLVYWHGAKPEGDTAIAIRLSGRYIGGQLEGTVAGPKVYRFKCPEDRWVLTDSTAEQKT